MKYLFVLLMVVGLQAQDDKVSVTWDLNTEADIFGYNVFIGESSGNYTYQEFVKHPKNKNEFWELTKGTTYYFAVTAVDTAGNESEFSEEVSLTIKSTIIDTTAPAIPTGINANELTEAQLIEMLEKFQYKVKVK